MLGMFVRVQSRYRYRRYTKHLSSNLFKRIAVFLSLLVILLSINTATMMLFENMSFADALWLSATTVTTVGYGDYSPSTVVGRLVTVVTMYFIAIALFGQIIGEYMEWRSMKVEKLRLGLWEFKKLENHIQIINTPNFDTEPYLNRLLGQIRCTPLLEDHPVQLLTSAFSDGVPASLKKHKLLHRAGEAENSQNLISIGVQRAAYIIILAKDSSDSISDSLTFDVLSRISDLGTKATIIVEAVNDENRARLYKAGANVVIRPIRAYPEIVVRSMTDPGTEQVMENIFSHQGGRLARVDFEFSNKKWSDIQCSIIQRDQGTPVAYVTEDGNIAIPDSNNRICSGGGVISLVSDKQSLAHFSYQAVCAE